MSYHIIQSMYLGGGLILLALFFRGANSFYVLLLRFDFLHACSHLDCCNFCTFFVQVGNTGFSITAAKKANVSSLVIGPGAGYNLVSYMPSTETTA